MNIEKYINEIVKILCNDGDIIVGKLINYTSELDNEPDGESITLNTDDGLIEIFTEEITSIKKNT